MLTTEHRPAPLPPRGAPSGAPASPRKPLPAGATKWSKAWLDSSGKPQSTPYEVPVDANDQRTEHVRHTCRGMIEVGGVKQACDQVAWLLPDDPRKHCPDHGCLLEPEGGARKEPLLPWPAMWRSVEPSARPLWILLAEAAAGLGVHNVDLPAWQALTGVPVLAAAGYAATRWWLTRRAVRNERIVEGQKDGRRVDTIRRRARGAAYAGTAAGGWLTVAAAVDPASPLGLATWTALPVLWALSSGPWWLHLARLRNRPAPPQALESAGPVTTATSASVGPDPVAVQDAEHWATTVAVSGGLQGTTVDVSTWQADDGGRRMVIRNQARRGALTDERLRQALPLIAGAFDVSRSAIGWVEEYEGSPNAALLLVQPNSPLNELVSWKPVDVLPAGRAVAHMGMRIDGSDLTTRLWTPGWGAPSRIILGTKGSGKSETVRLLILAMLKARIESAAGPRRLVAPFLHDPKRGADYGAFRRQVSGFSITSDTLHLIVEAFAREMERRYDALANTVWTDSKGRQREGERPFDPATMGPVLSLIMDEFHVDAKDKALMAKLDPMGRKMRAAGIELNVATHLATIGDTGSQGFRDMTAGGEAWLLRTTLGLNASLATGGTLTGDPRLLPRVAGMVLHASGEEATMQARVAYVEPEALYDLLYDDNNNSLIQPIEWPQETLDAFGPDFVQWMRECQQQPVGSAPVAPPSGFKPAGQPSTSAEDLKAFNVLLAVLGAADGPCRRPQVMEDPRWVWSTKTLTNVLRAGQDTDPPLLQKVDGSNGAYELTEYGRGWDQLERDRADAQEAEEQVAA